MAEHHIDIKLNGKSLFTAAPIAPCPHCPPEPIARELAIKAGMDEYLIVRVRHWRKRLDGSLIAPASYEIAYWHGLVRIADREKKLIESRISLR